MRPPTVLSCSFLCALLAMNATFAPLAFCAEPAWVQLDESSDSSFFYDQSGTSTSKEGIVRVTTRVVYTELGKADALKVLAGAKNMARLYESRYSHDLNCAERESRLLAAIHLDREGATLRSTDLASATEWEEIPPQARMALVAEEVCTR